MIHLLYVSTATRHLGTDELMDILETARANNARNSVTGMLLYSNDTFVQVLEGEAAVLDELLKIIQRDSRHKDLCVLERHEIQQPQYADWSMGFKRLENEDFRGVPGLNAFFEENFNAGNLKDKVSLIGKLLAHFRQIEQKRSTANMKIAAFMQSKRKP
jgi:hypothetical protein